VSMGAVEGRLNGLDVSMGAVEGRLNGLDVSMGAVEGRLNGLDVSMGAVEGRLNGLDTSMNTLQTSVSNLTSIGAVVSSGTEEPTAPTPSEGQLFFNTTDSVLKVYVAGTTNQWVAITPNSA
jgi:small nuclear ribonucleoprotein (snRNP)-like protein